MDGLRIWNLEKKKEHYSRLSPLHNQNDPVTAVVWITREDDVQQGLCCGTALGYLSIWTQRPNGHYDFEQVVSKRIGTGTEIMAISADTAENVIRLTTATRDQSVQVWSLDSKYNLSNIFSIGLPTTVPHQEKPHQHYEAF